MCLSAGGRPDQTTTLPGARDEEVRVGLVRAQARDQARVVGGQCSASKQAQHNQVFSKLKESTQVFACTCDPHCVTRVLVQGLHGREPGSRPVGVQVDIRNQKFESDVLFNWLTTKCLSTKGQPDVFNLHRLTRHAYMKMSRKSSTPMFRDCATSSCCDWSKRVNHHTLVYRYPLCYATPLYCTGALSRAVI